MRVGYWGTDAAAESVGAGANYNDASKDDPDPPEAYAEYDRYLSQLDVEHLKDMAAEIKGQYIKAIYQPELYQPKLYQFVQSQTPAAKFITAYSVGWIYLMIAALLVLVTYIPNIVAMRPSKRLQHAELTTKHFFNLPLRV